MIHLREVHVPLSSSFLVAGATTTRTDCVYADRNRGVREVPLSQTWDAFNLRPTDTMIQAVRPDPVCLCRNEELVKFFVIYIRWRSVTYNFQQGIQCLIYLLNRVHVKWDDLIQKSMRNYGPPIRVVQLRSLYAPAIL